jgi:DNA-binding response OmpR family regulator
MLVTLTSHLNSRIIALLSDDDNLAHIVYSTVEIPWRLERHFYNRSALEFLYPAEVGLVIVDDEAVSEGDRGWLLAQLRRVLHDATLLYVTGSPGANNERRARGNGAHYYTAKPVDRDEFVSVLKGFMSRANRNFQSAVNPK